MGFPVRGALPGGGGSLGAESSLQEAQSLGKGGAWRGARGKPARVLATRPSARCPEAAACWPGRGLAPRPGDLGKSRRKAALRYPHARGAARVGPTGARGVVAATPPRSPLGRPDTRCPFLSIYPLSLPLPCPVPGSPGGGALGAAGGAAGGSGAALAHAPGPGAVQLPRPQLALLRARPCTSLLNRFEGRGPRWEAPPLDSTPCRPGPSAPLSVSVLAVEATPARPFAHTRSLRAEAPFPDLATYLSEDPSIKVSGPTPKPPGRFSYSPFGPGASTFFPLLSISDFCRQAL